MLAGNIVKGLEAIKNAGGGSVANQLFEDTETAIEAYKAYEPINAKEQRSKVLLLQEYTKAFEGLLENAMNQGNKSQVFSQLNYDLLEERKKHAKMLEHKMETVKEIMKECNSMITTQGAVLDRIDSEVGSVESNTKKTAEELKISQSRQKHKKNCMIFTLCISTLLILGIVIVSFILGKL